MAVKHEFDDDSTMHSCEVGNPLKAGDVVRFTVRMDISNIRPRQRELYFNVMANTYVHTRTNSCGIS